jgi:hypothetical protein
MAEAMGKAAKATKSHVTQSSASSGMRALIYLNGIAALCMFASWLGQNIYQTEMSSRKSEIQTNSQFVSSEMSKALTWMLTFQTERRKEKPDPEIILNSATNYAETLGTIVGAASRIDPNSVVLTRHVDEHTKILGTLRAAVQKRDLNELQEATSFMMMWFGRIGPEAHDAINKRAQEVSEHEERAKWIFRGFFLLGSVVLAATWLKINVRPRVRA